MTMHNDLNGYIETLSSPKASLPPAVLMAALLSALKSLPLRSRCSSDVLCWRASMKVSALSSVKLLRPKLMECNRESQYSGVE